MKHQYETGATRSGPWPRKVIATLCALGLALLSVPLGVFQAPELAKADSYTVPVDAQASGTSNECSWYITSATDASNPGQLFIYPTDGTSGTLGSFYNRDAVPWHANADAIQTVSVAAGVKAGNTFSYAFADCSNVTKVDLTNLDTSNARTLMALFSRCTNLTSVPGFETLNVSNVTDFSYLFYYCESLPSADLSAWDLSSAEDMGYFFDSCYAITSIKLPTTVCPALTDVTQMFNHCKILTTLDVSCLANGKLKYMSSLFQGCQKLVNLTGYETLCTANTLRMDAAFNACNSLTSLDLSAWDTQNADGFYALFSNCKSLTSLTGLQNWDTSKVTSMKATFNDVSSMAAITGIENWDVSSVETFYQTFKDCKTITSLDLSHWSAPAATEFAYMFYECENLRVLDISGFDTTAATNMSGMFTYTRHLQQVTLGSKYTFTGNGSTYCVLPTPDSAYITGATGKWQAVAGGTVEAPAGTVYLPADVPSLVAETYVIEREAAALIPVLAERNTWYKGVTDKASITTINIVDSYTPGTVTESWDASAASDGSVMAYVQADGTTLTIAGNGYGKIFMNENASGCFESYTNLTTINGLSLLDTSNTTNLSGLFEYDRNLASVSGIEGWDVSACELFNGTFRWCTALTAINISSWDVSSATYMTSFFDHCTVLENLQVPAVKAVDLEYCQHAFDSCSKLETVDVSFMSSGKIQLAGSMFAGCTKLKSISGYETLVTAATTNILYMFSYCQSLENLDVSRWVTSNVNDLDYVFTRLSSIKSLTGLSSWDTAKVKSMSWTFAESPICDADLAGVAGWNVEKVVNFDDTFYKNSALTSLDLSSWNTAAAENMAQMFKNCQSLENLSFGPQFTTASVTNFSEMFSGCLKLKVLDISMFDTTAATDMTDMFKDMRVLQQVSLGNQFTFTGAGSTTCVLPTPDPAYISGATGKWQAVGTGTVSDPAGTVYLPADVPSLVAETYVMEKVVTPVIPVLAKSSTWYKGATDKTSITAVNIVDSYVSTGSEIESWDASAASDGSVMAYVQADGATLTIAGNGYGKIYANTDSSYMFSDNDETERFTNLAAINGAALLDTSNATSMANAFNDCASLVSLDVGGWDIHNVKSLAYMFHRCTKLANLDVSNWETDSCTNMEYLFFVCESLETLDVSGWETGNVLYMNSLFREVPADVLAVSNWDVSKVQDMGNMFYNCGVNSLNLSGWQTAACTSMRYMLAYCYDLTYLDVSTWNTSNVEDMDHLFAGLRLETIGVSGWDVSSVKDMCGMFYSCINLTSVDVSSWQTTSCTDMSALFRTCWKLASIDVDSWDTSKVTNFSRCFENCARLTVLDLSSWDTSKVTDASKLSKMFEGCCRLQQVTLGDKFSFNGGTAMRGCNLPTPDPEYIPGAIGKWQAVADGSITAPTGTIYDPVDIPNNVAETYVMPLVNVDIDVPIKVIVAVDAQGDFVTPTASANKIINHTVVGAKVVSAVAAAQGGFQLKQASTLASATQNNVFGGTIAASGGTASDLSAISTTGNNWKMAAGSVTDGSNQIALQLTGAIKNVKDHFLTVPTYVFGITYTFDLDI